MNNIESNLNDIISDILAEAIIINEAKGDGKRPNGGIRGLLAGLKRARSQKNRSQARRYERALDKMGYDYRKKKGGASKKSDGFNGSSKEEMRHMNEDDYYDYDDDYEYDDYDYMDEGWLGDKLKGAARKIKDYKVKEKDRGSYSKQADKHSYKAEVHDIRAAKAKRAAEKSKGKFSRFINNAKSKYHSAKSTYHKSSANVASHLASGKSLGHAVKASSGNYGN